GPRRVDQATGDGRRHLPARRRSASTHRAAMTLGVGIVGLPNVGKTTLFNALTRAGAGVASYAFSTVEPNTAMVEVPDKRLDMLAQMYNPKKVTPTVMKFVDVAGLVAGASGGEGIGNQFLSNIRELDALAMVVRSFTDPNVQHVDSNLDPRRDMAMVNLELALADLDVVNKRREKIGGTARLKPGAKEKEELELLDRLVAHLDEGKPIRTLSFEPEQAKLLKSFSFLTAKPVLYVANIGEDQIGKETPELKALRDEARTEGAEVIALSARLEAEIRELPDDEAAAFLEDAGLKEAALPTFIHAAYRLRNLVTFLTAGDPEGSVNMADDQVLLDGVAAGNAPPTLRFYSRTPACLSLGYFQPFSIVNVEGCRGLGIDIVRRPTGGRAILHDRELTYSVALPASVLGHDAGILPSYRRLSLALQAGLARLGIEVSLAPESEAPSRAGQGPVCFDRPSAHEILLRGRNVVGSAQVRRAGALLQHGSIVIEPQLATL